MAFGHFIVGVPHDRGAVDIGGNRPAEAFVEQIIFRGGGKIFAAPHHVGDSHQVIVHHVRKIIGGKAVRLDKHLIVQLIVFHGDVSENGVSEGCGARAGNFLPDHIGNSGGEFFVYFFLREKSAAAVVFVDDTAGRCGFRNLFLAAETAVGPALFDEQLGVFFVKLPTLSLDIRAHRAAYVGALVPI
ncbi:hypothetical protein SDC9_68301 [bioreactor metagenome]|uniref:Uncharacterized protein n=1 Tax=bioreactor metagenome TaxID=1076179 RepID=A0A644Y1R7_9ZZZZ